MKDIKTAFERSVKALTLRPSIGRGTSATTVRVTEGLACEITSGRWKLVADMPASSGGTATAPTPGFYGRAALGSCLAIGYQMRAAAAGVAIRSLEVVVEEADAHSPWLDVFASAKSVARTLRIVGT